jgi:fucose 4-O-acetylase-like acetyltransferase
MTEKVPQRENWLDVAKGIATICVVLGHILDGANGKGLFPDAHWMRTLYEIIYAFHMPLFFLLSGYAYELVVSEGTADRRGRKIKMQILNLLVLYVCWSGCMYYFKQLFSSVANVVYEFPFWYCLVLSPVDPYWYLLVLACYYFVFVHMRSERVMKITFEITAVITIIILPYIYRFSGDFRIRHFYRLLYYIPFFLSGRWYVRHCDAVKEALTRNIRLITGGGYITSILLIIWLGDVRGYPVLAPLIALLLSGAVVFLTRQFSWLSDNRILDYLGKHSLYVYVVHNYFTVLIRVIYIKLGMEIPAILYVLLNCLLTLLGCTAIQKITGKLWLLDMAFRPVKTVQRLTKKEGSRR